MHRADILQERGTLKLFGRTQDNRTVLTAYREAVPTASGGVQV